MMRQSYILDWALWVRMVINASGVEAGTQNVNCQDSPNAVIGLKNKPDGSNEQGE